MLPAHTLAASCPNGQPTDSSGQCCAPGEILTTTDRKCCPSAYVQYSGAGTTSCTQSASDCASSSASDPTGCLFTTYINPLINILSAAVGLVVVIGIIYGAIEYITSAGDPQKASSGKKHIMNALIGLAAFLFLYAFLQFIVPGGLFNGA